MSESTCGNCELCTFTIERSLTCYFNSYDTSGSWDSPANVVDGSMNSYGIFMRLLGIVVDWKPANSVIVLDANACITDTDTTRSIIKVELRAASLATQMGSGCDFSVKGILEPVFDAGVGDEHAYTASYISDDWLGAGGQPIWSDWLDITDDTNAPDTWTWDNVGDLDVNHFPRYTCAAGCGNPCCLLTFKVAIRVTWNESVQMYFPRSIDGGLSKNIDIFNLWKTTVKTRDSGLNSQPYTFSGVMMPICAIGGGAVLCFPVCFPLCFEAGTGIDLVTAPSVFKTIHEWIENHDKVTISCYGKCANGVYIIKQFSTHSMRSPDYYGYNLVLEKVRD